MLYYYRPKIRLALTLHDIHVAIPCIVTG